jgi:paired amphipathic helix protein Sin3a
MERATLGYGNKIIAGPPSPHMSHNHPLPVTSRHPLPADETHFFERVKRALDNRDTYNEFLKVVNLFTQDYIDTARLVKECKHFLGDGDLYRQFKEILGWDELKEREYLMAEFQNNWAKPTPVQLPSRVSRIDPSVKYGSYRRLSSNVRTLVIIV